MLMPFLFVKKVVSSANNVKHSSSKYQAISLIQMRKNIEPKIETRGTFDLKKVDIGLFNSLCLTADMCFPFVYRSTISIEVPLHLHSMLQLFQSDLLYQHSQKLSISQQNSLPLLLLFHFLKYQYLFG